MELTVCGVVGRVVCTMVANPEKLQVRPYNQVRLYNRYSISHAYILLLRLFAANPAELTEFNAGGVVLARHLATFATQKQNRVIRQSFFITLNNKANDKKNLLFHSDDRIVSAGIPQSSGGARQLR